jgi:hypothetical protein
MVRSQKSIGGAVGYRLENAPYKIGDRTDLKKVRYTRVFAPYKIGIALKLTASINVHGAFPKIDRWSSRIQIRERTLQDRRSHLNHSNK